MRALGASRGQVRRSVLLEAVVVGPAQLGHRADRRHRCRARACKALFGVFGAQLPDGPTIVATRTRDRGVRRRHAGHRGRGRACRPAARSRVAPLAALRDAATPDRSLRGRPSSARSCCVLGAAAMTKALRDGGLQLLGLGTLLAFIGIAMLSPLVSKPVASGVGRLFSRRLPGRLGRENAVRNPRRTAATAAALMIGLALISAVTVLGSSLKASVAKTVAGAITADFVLSTQSAGLPGRRAPAGADAARRAGRGRGQGRRHAALRQRRAAAKAKQVFVTAFPASAIGRPRQHHHGRRGPTDLAARTRSWCPRPPRRTTSSSPATRCGCSSPGPAPQTAHGRRHLRDQPADRRLPRRLHRKAKDFSTQRNVAALVSSDERAPTRRRAQARSTSRLTQLPERRRAGPVRVRRPGPEPGQPDRHHHQHPARPVGDHRAPRRHQHAGPVGDRAHPRAGPAARGRHGPQAGEADDPHRVGAHLHLRRAARPGRGHRSSAWRCSRRSRAQGVTELGFPVGNPVIYLVCSALAGVVAAALPARRASRLNVLQAIATE